jgi:hypothetical protein
MNNGVNILQRYSQRREIIQVAGYHVDTDAGRQSPLLIGRANKAAHLVSGGGQPRHHTPPDEPGRSRDKNHVALR